MTVSNDINKSGPYFGNGVTTVFDYDFRIVDKAHVKVIRTEGGAETVLTIDIDYTVSGVGNDNGGQITMAVAPTEVPAQSIMLLRSVPFTQGIDLENQGAYYAEDVERGFDLAVMRDQEISEKVDRALKIPASADPSALDVLVADILRLVDSADNIDAVAAISDDVKTAADNMPAILAATAAANTATAAADTATAAANTATAAADTATAAVAAVIEITSEMFGGVENAVEKAIETGVALRLAPGENAVINVPSQSASLASAVNTIRTWRIPVGASLTISIAAETMTMGGSGIDISHQDGARVFVVGAGKDFTFLEWDVSTITGIRVPAGYSLGKIDRLTIQLPTTVGRTLGVGLLADQGANILCGTDLRVRRFYWNYFSRLNGTLIADGTEGSNGGDANYLSYQGGHISCRGATGADANDAANFLGSGCVAEAGGTIDATDAKFTGNWLAGITALSDGSIRAGGADCSGNTGSGMLINGGSIDAQNSTRNNNGRYGVEWNQTNGMGWFHGPAASETGNALGTSSPHVEMFSGASAGLRAMSGAADEPLRLDAKGAASIYFNSGGAAQFEVSAVASAVNRLQVRGAAVGGRVSLAAFGPDANIGADIIAKGAGSVRLRSNGASVVDAYADNNAVNSLGVRARATGGAVAVEALGADTNIDLQLTPKGSGRIKITGWTASADAAVNGYIEVLDNAGVVRKLATTL